LRRIRRTPHLGIRDRRFWRRENFGRMQPIRHPKMLKVSLPLRVFQNVYFTGSKEKPDYSCHKFVNSDGWTSVVGQLKRYNELYTHFRLDKVKMDLHLYLNSHHIETKGDGLSGVTQIPYTPKTSTYLWHYNYDGAANLIYLLYIYIYYLIY